MARVKAHASHLGQEYAVEQLEIGRVVALTGLHMEIVGHGGVKGFSQAHQPLVVTDAVAVAGVLEGRYGAPARCEPVIDVEDDFDVAVGIVVFLLHTRQYLHNISFAETLPGGDEVLLFDRPVEYAQKEDIACEEYSYD